MLKEQSRRVVTFCAADFKPQIDFQAKLPAVAASIERSLGNVSWQAATNRFIIRSVDQPLLIVTDHQRIATQTIGYAVWSEGLRKHGDLIREALDAYGVASLKRLGFKIKATLDIGLTNAELRDLLFGSFLPKKSHFPPEIGAPDDPLVQLEGSVDDYRYTMHITAYNQEQAKLDFKATPNVGAFVLEGGDPRPEVELMRESIGDSLLVDLDLFKADIEVSELRLFLTKSLELAERFVDSSIRFIKTIPSKQTP
jgi:hypothetical protein